jgi:flavin reductase (DIM6/NTAB) family NADH-FMN oxidoreductase RutF
MTRRKPETKVEIPTDKAQWRPSLLAGQIVLISSKNTQGEPHAARKSWIMMACASPPTLALSCHLSHRTAINILETREFVVNIPGDDLVARVWGAGDGVSASMDPGETSPWTYGPSVRVSAPRVQECRAHIECALDAHQRLRGENLIFFGRIVSVSVDESLLTGEREDRYRALRSIIYLEEDLFAVIDGARKIPT